MDIFGDFVMGQMDNKPFRGQIQRAQIGTLHNEGYSERDISVNYGISKTVIHNAIFNFEPMRPIDNKQSDCLLT